MNNQQKPDHRKESEAIKKCFMEYLSLHQKKLSNKMPAIDSDQFESIVNTMGYVYQKIKNNTENCIDNFSKVLLNTFYPHLTRPISPMSIAFFDPRKSKNDAETLPKGSALTATDSQGKTYTFTTCYPVDIPPFVIDETHYQQSHHCNDGKKKNLSTISINIKLARKEASFSLLNSNHLRFFIAANLKDAYRIYDAIFTRTENIFIQSDKNNTVIKLPGNLIKPVGFDIDQSIISFPDNVFIGYRYLLEYLYFPYKFLFFDLSDIKKYLDQLGHSTVSVRLSSTNYPEYLENIIKHDTFYTGCTPIIHSEKKQSKKIDITHRESTYPIVFEQDGSHDVEIQYIEKVTLYRSDKKATPIPSIYSKNYYNDKLYWYTEEIQPVEDFEKKDSQHLSSTQKIGFINPQFNPLKKEEQSLTLDMYCFNSNINHCLGKDRVHLTVSDDADHKDIAYCITEISKPVLADNKSIDYLKAFSTLHDSMKTLYPGSSGSLLKNLFSVHNINHSAELDTFIQTLISVESQNCSMPLRAGNHLSFCRGVTYTIKLSSDYLKTGSVALIANLFSHFFGLCAPVNLYSQVIVSIQDHPQEQFTCPPRIGNKTFPP